MKKITQRNLWAVGCAALVCGSAVMASAVVDKRHMVVDKAAKREALAVGAKAVGKAALPSRAVEADGILHFFSASDSRFAMLDMGIGLEHFIVGATAGKWKKLDVTPPDTRWRYVISRTAE